MRLVPPLTPRSSASACAVACVMRSESGIEATTAPRGMSATAWIPPAAAPQLSWAPAASQASLSRSQPMTADRWAKAGPDSLSSQPQLVNAARAFMNPGYEHGPLHEVRRVTERQQPPACRQASRAPRWRRS